MPTITILREGADTLISEIAENLTLFEAGAKVAAGIDTSCVGKGTCGLCRVKIIAGAEHTNAFTDEERKHLGNVYHITKVRLACRTKVTGDVTIQIVKRKK
jgi:ferredoxin